MHVIISLQKIVPAGVSRDRLNDGLRWSVTGSEEEGEGRSEEGWWGGRRYLSNDIIATEPVLVHDSDNYGRLPQHVGRHVKGKGLVENRVQAALHYHRLLLLHALVLVHQPHFNVGV